MIGRTIELLSELDNPYNENDINFHAIDQNKNQLRDQNRDTKAELNLFRKMIITFPSSLKVTETQRESKIIS